MFSEIELYFGGGETDERPATMTLHTIERNTVTEIGNLHAYAEMKKQGATGVSFGPPVPRNERGLPA